ncbi:class F sortase [Streptomyces sp. ISL-66]|uniref:sortase domain-containing protein n=1 Tax=Streptomyces sp. ISL-66 TaxID=2819186 RepID=UPI001BEBF858|nr:sortase [Streptomyces sp. ISL-66]MBT2470264.1 class F sortase [Streptomyces sp. ISL-66]
MRATFPPAAPGTRRGPVPRVGPGTRRAAVPRVVASTALALAVAGALSACGSGAAKLPPDPKVGSTAAPAPAAAAATPALPKSKPTGMKIAAAGVDAKKMVDLKVDPASGELGVPSAETDANNPGWWTEGVTPGEQGVSVLVAHFDTKYGPALMKNVKDIELGDVIEVPREDGRTARFKIREIEDVDKKQFPTDKVYGATNHPELRLLTCGGTLKNGHRTNNVIFYADLLA